MTEKDIKAQKDEMKNKKLDIFTQMITYKKKDIKKSVSFEDSPSITNNSVISFFVAPNDGLEVLDGPTGSLRPDGSAISEDIKEEIEGIFEFIEKDGLNPYDMSFDEFYKWASEKFRLEYPKSFYETEFKNKVHNPNQIKLDLNENKKIKSFKQWS